MLQTLKPCFYVSPSNGMRSERTNNLMKSADPLTIKLLHKLCKYLQKHFWIPACLARGNPEVWPFK